ncbi:hypothetical protein RIF23_19190 [Lipingzhangella sp. LS1_29]|uniref:J domain-containing protein n=1 Tax=Lipingzhangella rawalii TaxID=2055835 RepID=A0ABU2HAY3_9ACTN|nr:hypothetical protein [Lipingzhangella rawalii]MDS1272418.1 hypothetical protein [Lipingzhangella rawalii]
MRNERARYRQWVRRNHPDLGGDPTVFAAGMASWRRGRDPDAPGTGPVHVFRAPRTPLGVLLRGVRRWYARRRGRRVV